MRTTLSLDEELLSTAKRRAEEQGTTLSSLVETALRALLSATEPRRKRKHFKLVTFRGEPTPVHLDLDKTSALLSLEDEEQYRG